MKYEDRPERKSKNKRALDMYVDLCEGKTISKKDTARKYDVDERTIQRDIDEIRMFLDERKVDIGDAREIVYDRTKKGFVMTGEEPSMMTNSEILAVSKILLESRAFTKKEIKIILGKLIEGCVPYKNMKLVSELISNEQHHYVELKHKEYIQDRLWNIGSDIHEHNLISIRYARAYNPDESVKRVVEPLAIIFSEYYFYLNAFIVEKNDEGKYVHKYEYPAIFRIDRIKNYKQLDEKFKVEYANRFEEGEFRKRIQFMYAGELVKVTFRFYGKDVESVLDRLPTARIIKQNDKQTTFEAEVYGDGIVMWFLSQGSKVEVLKPERVKEEMKKNVLEMMKYYE